jgi:hypothetical protein
MRMFSEDQLERLRSFPDIGKDDLTRAAPLVTELLALVPAVVTALWVTPGRRPSGRKGVPEAPAASA